MACAGSLPASWGKPERTLTSDVLNETGNNFMILDLANNSLKGTLPAEWAGMDMLTYLYLSNNYLSGSSPSFATRHVLHNDLNNCMAESVDLRSSTMHPVKSLSSLSGRVNVMLCVLTQ